MLFIFDILCPLVSLFHQSRKLCPISVSSRLIFLAGLFTGGGGGIERVWGAERKEQFGVF